MSAFVPAPHFSGPRPGWFFGTGPAGTGYYRDDRPGGRPAATARDADGFAIPAARPPAVPAAAPTADGAALLAAAEAEAGWSGDAPLDGRAARRLAAALDKAAAANAAARARHPDAPDKFMASELALDAAVRACGPLAAFAGAWADFAEAGGPASLATLIASHENADIAAGALDVLSALADEEAGGADEDDDDDGAAAAAVASARAALVAGLRSGAVPAAIAARLPTLDEGVAEEAAAVADGLAVLQAVVEVDPAGAADVAAPAPFLAWLLDRVVLGSPGKPGARAYDAVTGAASELVAVLAQAPAGGDGDGGGKPPPARAALLAAGAVDALLRGLASYRARDPADAEEGEHLENLGDALCALLVGGGGGGGSGGSGKNAETGSPAQAAFLEAEGVELAVLLLRKKGAAAGVALRALDFALPGCPAAAARTVEAGGLGPVFAAFMGRAKAALGGGGTAAAAAAPSKKEALAAEARAVGVVCHLLQGVGPAHPARARLAAKLAEGGGEKCERAVDLFAKWEARVGARADAAAARSADPAALARARLDAGLFTLHQLALILGHAWGGTGEDGPLGSEAAATTRRAVVAALHSRGGTLARVRAALREYRGELGDGGGDAVAAAAADAERGRVAAMLAEMGEGGGGGGGGGRAAEAAAPGPPPPPPPPPPAPVADEDDGDRHATARRSRSRSRERERGGGSSRDRGQRDRPRSRSRDRGGSGRHRSRSPRDRRGGAGHRRRSRSRSRSPRRRRS